MLYKFSLSVPTYNQNEDSWSTTTFDTLVEFRDFLDSIFKEPGKYDFDETSFKFNEQARLFNLSGNTLERRYYCNAAYKSKDFRAYWDGEKAKCRKGVIFIHGKKTWYLTRDYYMWLNFLPIYNKEISEFGFADVRDVQYHMALYEIRAELHFRHCSILKKRQIASSYFHIAKLANAFWFEKGATLKIGAAREDYINLKGSWKFFNEYRDFLHKKTAWYRPCTPDKVLNWQQKIEVTTEDGKKSFKGNKSMIVGTSFEKRADAGVGGPCSIFFHEEGGIAPKADKTFFFIKPAMRSGMITTGVFIIAGSVGELDMCGPLKDMMLRPGSDFLSVDCDLIDHKGTKGKTGLFIPEQWSMPPYIDEFGNSLVKEALEAIMEERKQWKIDYTPEKYQYEVSQHPINIKEAFDFRQESVFPLHLIQRQLDRIEKKEVFYEYLSIERDENGFPKFTDTRRYPVPYPTDMKAEDKRGCLIVHERPPKDPDWGVYVASVDTVGEGKTTTSNSLFCIQIYKMPIEKTTHSQEGSKVEIEGDKLVASWTGRYDDINDTHEYASMLLEIYNAWAVVEANVSLFINFMILKKRQKYLVPKSQIVFLKEQESHGGYQEYGWKNVGTLFKGNLLSYGIEFMKEVIDQVLKDDGDVVKTIYGIERIGADEFLLKEAADYHEGLNVDRLVTYCALVAFVKLLVANRGYKKLVKYEENFKKSKDLYKLNLSNPFKNIGRSGSSSSNQIPKNPFKNIR